MKLTVDLKSEVYDRALAKAGEDLEAKMPLLTVEQKGEFSDGFEAGWVGHKLTEQESWCTMFGKGVSEGRLCKSRIEYVMSILSPLLIRQKVN